MSFENETIDVASKGCNDPYDKIACTRNCVLVSLIILTFMLSVYRLFRLHYLRHPQIHQYVIFYFVCFECIICAVNWILGGSRPQMDISASYLKLLQFIVMSHFYWTLAARILHKEHLVYRVIIPILSIYAIYFTTVAIYGIISTTSSWTECLKKEWLMMSAAEFLAVQSFMLAGHYINVKINSISALESFKKSQKRELWCLIIAFELSALVSVVYDIIMRTTGDKETGCSGIYGHNQYLYSSVFGSFMIIKYIVPIWMMLIIFRVSTTRLNEIDESLPQCPPSADSQRRTSMFDDQRESYEHYRDPAVIPEVYCNPRRVSSNNNLRRSASLVSQTSQSSQSKLLSSGN